eukprot:jgi/Ulvmu1/7587/UM038_0010.1
MFAGQLGDGAATSIGEVEISHKDAAHVGFDRWELQFKGAGLTPYSRAADGRKVLRSSLREFLASEAMHHLGVPTSRAASICLSATMIVRDPDYSGSPIQEPASVVLRLAPSFVRFGSFEVCKTADRSNTGEPGPSAGQVDVVRQLADYVIKQHLPDAACFIGSDGSLYTKAYVAFYKTVVESTACLLAKWQCVGFCHGVMNTDNMSILGLTLDYGLYAFLDRYDDKFVGNTSDDSGRYAFGKLPEITLWSLKKFAEELSACLELEQDVLEQESTGIITLLSENYAAKVGLGRMYRGLRRQSHRKPASVHAKDRS